MATRKTPAKAAAKKPATKKSQQKFMRNARNMPISVRLEEKRIELKPRGQRGDLAPVRPEYFNDTVFLENYELGLYEIITEAEANDVISKQTHNQKQVHPALAQIRNAKGDLYNDDAVVVRNEADNAVTVARLQDGNVVVGRGGIDRNPASVTQAGEALEAAQATDAAVRASKGQQGIEAGLGGLNVVVEPPQKG